MRRHYWRRGIIHKAYLCGLSTVDKPPKNFQIINHPLNTAMPMAHAALGNHVVGKMLYLGHITFQHRNLQAVVMTDMQYAAATERS